MKIKPVYTQETINEIEKRSGWDIKQLAKIEGWTFTKTIRRLARIFKVQLIHDKAKTGLRLSNLRRKDLKESHTNLDPFSTLLKKRGIKFGDYSSSSNDKEPNRGK